MVVVTLLIAPTTTSFSAVETLVTKQQTMHKLLIGNHADTCILLGFTANTNDASLALPSPAKIANFAYFHCLLILPNEVILYSTLTHLYNHANIHTTNLVDTYFFFFFYFLWGQHIVAFYLYLHLDLYRN